VFEVRRELLALSLELVVEAAFQFLTEAVGALLWHLLFESLEFPNPLAGGVGCLRALLAGLGMSLVRSLQRKPSKTPIPLESIE